MTKDEAETLLARYTTRTQTIENRPKGWDYLDVEILLDGKRIGAYQRNYSPLFDTFVPFVQQNENGECRVFALYSRHYTATRLMRLPECEDLGGEEPSDGGFCPTGFFVPFEPERGLLGQFGFLSGCVWGDDSSWKIGYLDLSNAANGLLKRDNRFGYLELPPNMALRDAVNFRFYRSGDEHSEIEFTTVRAYLMEKGHFVRDYDGNHLDDDEPTP